MVKKIMIRAGALAVLALVVSAFAFGGAAAQQVSPIHPDAVIVGTLPAQETILSRDNDLLSPANASMATIIYRLFSTGTYTVIVGGTPGDFILTLETEPAVTPVVLNLDVPVPLTIPFDVAPAVFAFNTDPALPTTIHIDAEPFNLNSTVEVRDGSGQLVTLLQGDIDNACVSS